MQFTLLKTGPYNPLSVGATRYEGYLQIGKREADPSLDSSILSSFALPVLPSQETISAVFVSEAKRTQQTAQHLMDSGVLPLVPIRIASFLNEVPFDLSALCTESEYEKGGSALVRERFMDAFVQDALLESRSSLQHRMEVMERVMKEAGDNSVAISHTFFIRLFDVWKRDYRLFQEPERLRFSWDPSHHLMPFLGTSVHVL